MKQATSRELPLDNVPTLPKTLFKYRSINDLSLKALADNQQWVSSPEQFNDPFDCDPDFIDGRIAAQLSELSRDECLQIIEFNFCSGPNIAMQKKHLSQWDDDELVTFLRYRCGGAARTALTWVEGVYCMSATCRNPLMWGHYADCQRGFCLEFDTTDEPFSQAQRVEYSRTMPDLRVKALCGQGQLNMEEFVLTKFEDWRYEQEWRIVDSHKNYAFTYDPRSLVGLYFGAKTTDANRQKILDTIPGREIPIYQMRLHEINFELVPERIR